MSLFTLAAELGSCGSAKRVMRSPLDLVQFIGELLIPAAAIWIVAAIVRRHPTDVPRYTSERITKLLDRPAIRMCGLLTLAAGLLIFGASIFITADGRPDCTKGFAVVAALGMLVTLCGAMVAGLAWAIHARNLTTFAQIRAGEAGRSGGAVLSALTLSALALTMGSGYTKYREVMAERTAGLQSPS